MTGAQGVDRIPVLHAVTNDEIVLRTNFLDRARRVMHAGGARVAVHVRAPRLSGRRLYELACSLAPLQDETGAWLVVTERVDVALSSGARGVQLTSRSMASSDARAIASRLAIGASVHSRAQADLATDGGATWLVAGHADGERHRDADGAGTDLVSEVAAGQVLPVIVIGGVRPEHLPALRGAGAYGVAVIRGVWNASDAGSAVIDYLSAHGTSGGR